MSTVTLLRGLRATVLPATAILLASFAASLNGQTPNAGATTNHQSVDKPNGAAQAPAAGANDAKDGVLPIGRVIYAELTQTIDARKAKPGQPIFARATLGVLSHGKVLIAEGARISGHVTEVKARTKDDPESTLGIVFDQAETIDGRNLPLELTVQAIGVGSLRPRSDVKVEEDHRYSAVPGPMSMGSADPSPRADRDEELPAAETKPALDLGSKGIVGVKELTLAGGKDPANESLVKSIKKDVKLDNRWQLVLRVVGPRTISNKIEKK